MGFDDYGFMKVVKLDDVVEEKILLWMEKS